jgi:formylglycine-generating enzyme required for sulfatase activity
VACVSYYAAEAFAQWVNSKLPAKFQDYRVRLPFSTEWEWAIKLGGPFVFEDTELWNKEGPRPVDSDFANKLGIKNLVGNVWEWSEDWNLPVKNLLSSLNPSHNTIEYNLPHSEGAEKIVRGGSWATRKEEMTPYIKGSQPPNWCTPYLGFRITLAPKK